MNPELALCAHFAGLAVGDPLPEIAHAFLFQDGPIDAIARCRSCGSHALLRLLDWAPARFSLRVYSLASLRAEDSALFLRNVERGSCQVSRASAELDALIAAAGPSTWLVALDLARERVAASAALPTSASGEPGAWPARLPRESDVRWFAALGLEKGANAEMHALATEISATHLTTERDAAEFLALVDAYARDPMGGGAPLREDVRARLVPDLRERIAGGGAVVLLARRAGAPSGVAVCFVGYSTFNARPLLNLHDLAVMPDARGTGVGQALLAAVASHARALGCCKVTLEVREDNARARRVYEHVGFVDYSQGGSRTRTLFLEQKL